MDVDKRESPEFEKYIHLLQEGSQGSIPYTVILDEKGNKVAAWVGAVPYSQMVQDSKAGLERIR